MPNEILKSEVVPKSQIKTKSTTNKDTKTEPSLFDKMLNKNKSNPNIENKEVQSKTKIIKDNTTSIKNDKKPSLFDTMKSKTKNTQETIVNTQKVKTSLFDKLKDTSKKDLKVTVNTKNEAKTSLFDKLKDTSKIEVTKKDVKNGEKIKDSKLTTNTKNEAKTSLFDKLKDTSKVEVSKKDIKNSEKIKDSKITENTVTESKASLFDNLKNTSKNKSKETIENVDKISNTINNKEVSSVLEKKENKSKITNDNITENINVNLEKSIIDVKTKEEVVLKKDISKNKKTSLLDSLVNDIKNKPKENIKVDSNNTKSIKEKLNAKTFLSNQQTKATIISKHHLDESKKILTDDNKIDAKNKIISSAKTLELNPSVVKVKTSEESKELKKLNIETKINEKVIEQTTFLNKVLFKQALNINNEQRIQEIKIVKSIDDSTSATKEIKAKDIEINEVSNQTAIQNITNKIISARQNMKSFMSDMARKMYENYKPPVTAFKINLNPAHLGSISIIMKSNKAENSVSISLNTSSNATLEVLEGSRSLLQSSLQKTFSNENNFSLDFSQNNNESNTNEQENKNKSANNKDIQEDEPEELIENDISIDDDYM